MTTPLYRTEAERLAAEDVYVEQQRAITTAEIALIADDTDDFTPALAALRAKLEASA